eukprot:TRINITY_DN1595_c0_g1_i1.p1 TRINITY_DN1595_c0_g1~~TRINITY_DN1595_c0_g1_i1.p1  ORF type:complete len:927 (-),score=242.76 TRINITY_DN1595_c0_g1_i1:3-2783(-)
MSRLSVLLLSCILLSCQIPSIFAQKPWSWNGGSSIPDFAGSASNPSARSYAASGSTSTVGYIFGGTSGSTVNGDFWSYTFSSTTFASLSVTNGPTPRTGAVGHATSTTFYVFGGQDASGNILGDLYAYNIAAGTWSTLTSAPGVRAFASIADNGAGFYVYGGQSSDGFEGTIYAFDGTSWTTPYSPSDAGLTIAASKPGNRQQAGVWLVGSTLYVYGGIGCDTTSCQSSNYLSDLWSFSGSTWTYISGSTTAGSSITCSNTALTARAGFNTWADTTNNILYLFGGFGFGCDGSSGYGALSDTWGFTISTGKWALAATGWNPSAIAINLRPVYGNLGEGCTFTHPSGRAGASLIGHTTGFLIFGGGGNVHGYADVWESLDVGSTPTCTAVAPPYCPNANDALDAAITSTIITTSGSNTIATLTFNQYYGRSNWAVTNAPSACDAALTSVAYTGTAPCYTGLILTFTTSNLWTCATKTSPSNTVRYDWTSTLYLSDQIGEVGAIRNATIDVPLALTYATTVAFQAYGYGDFQGYNASIAQSFEITLDVSGGNVTGGQLTAALSSYLSLPVDNILMTGQSYGATTVTFNYTITYKRGATLSPSDAVEKLWHQTPNYNTALGYTVTRFFPIIGGTPLVNVKFPSQKIQYDPVGKVLTVLLETYTSYPSSAVESLVDPAVSGLAFTLTSVNSTYDSKTSSNLQWYTLQVTITGPQCSFDLPLTSNWAVTAPSAASSNYNGAVTFSLAVSNLCPVVQNNGLTASGAVFSDLAATKPQGPAWYIGKPIYVLITFTSARAIASTTVNSLKLLNTFNNETMATLATGDATASSPVADYSRITIAANQVKFSVTLHSGYIARNTSLMLDAELGVVYSGGKKRQTAADGISFSAPFFIFDDGASTTPQGSVPGDHQESSAGHLAVAASVVAALFFLM